MASLKTIAIVGAAGNMGSAIARSLAKDNYRLLLMAKEQAKLDTLKADLEKSGPKSEILTIGCAREASWEADIIILATPYGAEKEIADKIRDVAKGKIVISISNPLNGNYDGLVTAPGTSAAEELQKILPHSKVVKAFNSTFAADFNAPVIGGQTIDAFIAGDDEEALETVTGLVKSAGFNPVVAGGLSASGTLERMQLLLIRLGMKYNYNWHAGWKILHDEL
jgi:NADPH-dependent F420 reductase